MNAEKQTFLIYLVWFAAIVFLVWVIMSIARAADMKDCHAYANRGSAAALRQLLGMPFVDVTAGRFLYRKAYSYCLNADELPTLTFTPEEQPIVDGLPSPQPRPEPPPGSVPATDPTEPPVKSKPVKGEPLCIRQGKQTIYSGRHWRCVR